MLQAIVPEAIKTGIISDGAKKIEKEVEKKRENENRIIRETEEFETLDLSRNGG